MSEPVKLSRYIMICVSKPLDEKEYKAWYKVVHNHTPSGIVTTVQSVSDKGKPTAVHMVHRETKNHHSYLIPLTRDLRENEIQKIVDLYSAKFPDLDFDVETNESQIITKDNGAISMDSAEHHRLCMALEKKKHEDWVRERTNSGWRYGTSFSTDQKTHPLILPWDQLPDKFRKADLDWPQKLVDILRDQGYLVIKKDELDSILKFVRGVL